MIDIDEILYSGMMIIITIVVNFLFICLDILLFTIIIDIFKGE